VKLPINIILILGISGIIVTSWMFVIVPELKKVPSDFELLIQENSYAELAMKVGGPLIDIIDRTLLTSMKSKIIDGETLEITVIIGPANPDVSGYSSEKVYLVDRSTKKLVNDDSFFMFPTNTKKQDYLITHPSVSDTNVFVFQDVEKIFGLKTYVFSCENFGTDITGNNFRFPDIPLFYDGTCSVWIEPKTGNQIKFEQSWNTYTIDDGVRIDISAGNKENSYYASSILVDSTKNKIQLYYVYDYVVPVLLGLVSLGVLITIFSYIHLRKQNQTIITISEKLIKAERISSIGELSARIAHDIRNPLGVIRTSVENIRMKSDDPEFIKKSVIRCDKAIQRITHQIEEVMDFLKDSPLDLEPVSLLDSLKSSIAGITIPDGIKMIFPTKDVGILGDKIKLESLFYNLIINAIQKLKNEGIITIKIFDEPDNMVKITIEDNGKSIPEDYLKKIFEPLFTTKQIGTGLGLASCKMIVQQHQGTITVTNNPVTFTLILPSAN